MPRVIVVDPTHGDPALDKHVGVNRYVGVGIDQTAEHVPAAGAQHLQPLRDDFRNPAHFDHGIGAVRPA